MRRQASQGLQPFRKVIGGHEGCEMLTQLVVAVVGITFDCRLFEGSVHSFNLTIRPGMIGLGQAMLDAVLAAAQGEHVRRKLGRWAVGPLRFLGR